MDGRSCARAPILGSSGGVTHRRAEQLALAYRRSEFLKIRPHTGAQHLGRSCVVRLAGFDEIAAKRIIHPNSQPRLGHTLSPGYTTCSSPQTGTGTLTEQTANGVYSATDFTFGQFTCGYGDSPPAGTLGLNDLCDNLFMTGTDKYGDSYTITLVSVTATVLTFDWINTYGDGGRVAMTRTDAKTWPLGLNTN